MLPFKTRECLQQFSEYKEQQTLTYLLQITVPNDKIDKFNVEFEMALKCVFYDMIKNNHIYDVISLLNVLVSALKNPIIKCKLVLNLLQDFFECLSFQDLKKIIGFVYENIKKFKNLQKQQIYLFHKILKFGLSRFAYGESLIRGKLHLLIAFVLDIAHQSGMRYKQVEPKTIQNLITLEQFEFQFQNKQLNYELYHNYWKLQKYLMHQQKKEENKVINRVLQIYNSNSSEDLVKTVYGLVSYVSQIVNLVNYIIKYFNTVPVTKQIDVMQQLNIDLTPLPHYFFKLTLIFQILIYCSNLNDKIVKNKISNKQIKQFIQSMESISKDYILSHLPLKEGKYLFNVFDKYFQNQTKWIQIKNNTKQFRNSIKKPYYKIKKIKQNNPYDIDTESGVSHSSIFTHNQNSIERQIEKYRQVSKNQLCIQMDKMKNYLALNEKSSPKFTKMLSMPSFSLYFEESLACFQTFSYKNKIQTYFYDSQYNLFQWKAMRSLCRQNSSFLLPIQDVNPIFKSYPLLQFMRKKGYNLYCQPKKKMKPSEQQTDPQ